ncbi:uncharacterized protein VTP21DRAFT_3045 [Calcarisporiella thermophila]|uniref:uncharacterized protein n=1 Tax=Calcarisporiella thermophila TaxID=911321 RepID=UPI003743BEAB
MTTQFLESSSTPLSNSHAPVPSVTSSRNLSQQETPNNDLTIDLKDLIPTFDNVTPQTPLRSPVLKPASSTGDNAPMTPLTLDVEREFPLSEIGRIRSLKS